MHLLYIIVTKFTYINMQTVEIEYLKKYRNEMLGMSLQKVINDLRDVDQNASSKEPFSATYNLTYSERHTLEVVILMESLTSQMGIMLLLLCRDNDSLDLLLCVESLSKECVYTHF